MLKELSISNFVLIDTLKVSFLTGMTSVTGETGAGKSIILGALSLVLGKRADLSCLKDTNKKCTIEASFDISLYNLKDLFDTENIDYDKETILRRELIPNGKSRAFINDTPVKLETLNKFSKSLIDIHSQNGTQALLSKSFQYKFLDSLSDNIQNLMDFKTEFSEFNNLIKTLKNLNNKKEAVLKESDYQLFLYNELEGFDLKKNTLNILESEVSELRNIDVIEKKLSSSIESINAEEIGVLNKLSDILNNIKSIEKFSQKFKDYNFRIESLYIELRDILNDFENKLVSLETNPQLLIDKNSELDSLYLILKKHEVSTIEELIIIKKKLSKAFFDSKSLLEQIEKTSKVIDSKKKSLTILSNKINDKRIDAIPKIELELKSLVLKLGMKNASFKLNLTESDDFNEFGKNNLELLFSSNTGSSHKLIKKAVSGGELSRIMLSIKFMISKFLKLPTIIFDEIDTGVSGSVANEIGMLMKEMSESTQVFTITHIPQVAARGTNHIKVFKRIIKSKTVTNLKNLNNQEREDEIALMLSGKKMTISALEHARELLD